MQHYLVFAIVVIAVICAAVFPKYTVHISLATLLILFLHLFRMVYKMQNKTEKFVMIGGGPALDKLKQDGLVTDLMITKVKNGLRDDGFSDPTDNQIIDRFVETQAISEEDASRYRSLANVTPFSIDTIENLASMFRDGTLKVTNLEVSGKITTNNLYVDEKLRVHEDAIIGGSLLMVDRVNKTQKNKDTDGDKYNTVLNHKGELILPKLVVNATEGDPLVMQLRQFIGNPSFTADRSGCKAEMLLKVASYNNQGIPTNPTAIEFIDKHADPAIPFRITANKNSQDNRTHVSGFGNSSGKSNWGFN